MSRREIRTTRRDADRARRQAEQNRQRQAETDYWTTFVTGTEADR
ncbi:hypothetical protein O7626_19400 [Micromonospora sp. WMMD1102]|nr:hypothetical protein [Micromonospora sp. WMMD1102]MDG4788080.1 hypothetical protein [Micromonospora sp. WMMD1102]